MILEMENAVLRNRDLMGATNPKDAEEGTIRKNTKNTRGKWVIILMN